MLDSTRSTSLVTFCRCSSVRRASRHRRLLETSIAIKLHQLGSNPVTAPAKRHDNDSQGPIFRGDSIETDNQAYLSRGSIETGSEVLKFPFGDDKRTKVERMDSLRSFGMSGMLAYGFLNSLYYGLGMLITSSLVCQVRPESSVHEIAYSLARVFAYTWAGSQLTKTFRIVAAIALSTPVNKCVKLFSSEKMFSAQAQVYITYVLLCLIFVLACVVLLALSWLM